MEAHLRGAQAAAVPTSPTVWLDKERMRMESITKHKPFISSYLLMVFGSTVTTPATASPATASPATASPATASLTANTNAFTPPCSRNCTCSKFPFYIFIQYFSFKKLKLVCWHFKCICISVIVKSQKKRWGWTSYSKSILIIGWTRIYSSQSDFIISNWHLYYIILFYLKLKNEQIIL